MKLVLQTSNIMKHKELLFDKYSKNFERIQSLVDITVAPFLPAYVCPLCRKYFTKDHLKTNRSNHLTIEHIPPVSVGGKEVILVCKKCNNSHGSKFDSHLIKMLELEELYSLKPGASKNTSFNIEKRMKTDGTVWISENQIINFLFDLKRTNPKYHEEIKKLVMGKSDKISAEFSMNTYNAKKAAIALLRAAYLKTFKELGYAFLLNWNSEIVRSRIMGYNSIDPLFNGILKINDDDPRYGLNLIKDDRFHGYIVTMKISKDEIVKNYGVLIPGGDTEARNIYTNMDSLRKTSRNPKHMNFELISLSGNDFVSDNYLFALEHWAEEKNSY